MDIEDLKKQKNNAYWERNQLVAALSKMFPSHLAKHPDSDKEWEDDWRTIVVVYIPLNDNRKTLDVMGEVKMLLGQPFQQLTWHIHDTEVTMFDHLEYAPIIGDHEYYDEHTPAAFQWDGHTTEEKYRRLRTLPNGLYVTTIPDMRKKIAEGEAHGRQMGERTARNIADGELRAKRLREYEDAEIISVDLQTKRGYPKGAFSRGVLEDVVQSIVRHHRKQIENTHTAEEGEARDMMTPRGHDPRLREL